MNLVTTITILASPAQIWQAMFDPLVMSRCMPGLVDWEELEPRKAYRLLMNWGAAGSGKLQVPVVVKWEEAVPDEYAAWVADVSFGSNTLPITGSVRLNAEETAKVNVELTAQMGAHPIFSPMANNTAPKILVPLFKCLRAHLEKTNHDN
ncbi:MAG: hypothetical protein H6662_15040 [Ardenticatenaceae bacterium]|nr:hypothetical protein [Anaerolineales bacterium]MCB8922902.1 hypothetical protein [Ardenticatenaceae bacterium]MCB8990362.1 hypothetical protein [Ardenticatenaceae bacterium]MCB9005255.1 hypothetical protein [Ardenticatenaceae bacterium]